MASAVQRKPMAAGKWLLLTVAFFGLYGLLLFLPLVTGAKAPFWHDVSIAYLPLRTSAAEAISDGHLPLWDSRIGNGFPVLAEGQAGVFYPLHVIGYTGLPQYQVYAILLWLHCTLGGVFAALLCRVHGMRLMPCLAAGLIYGYSGFFITHGIHITLVETAAWLPLVLVCLELWLRNPKGYVWLLGAAAALGVQELVAMPQIFFYSVIAAVLYMAIGAFVAEGRHEERAADRDGAAGTSARRIGRAAGATCIVLALAVGLAAIQVLPTYNRIRTSPRTTPTPAELRELSLAPRNLAYFVHPHIFGSYPEGNYFGRDHYYEVCGFVGTMAVLFGLIGLIYGSGRARAFAGLLVPIALFLALAGLNPLYEYLVYVPGFKWFRGAGRYVLLSSLGFSMLAGLGLQRVIESTRARKTCLALAAAGVLLCIAVPAGFRLARPYIVPKLQTMVARDEGEGMTRHEQARQKYKFLASRLSPANPDFLMLTLGLLVPAIACGISRVRSWDMRWFGQIAVLLALAQLYVFARDYNPGIDTAYYETPPILASHLSRRRAECVYLHHPHSLADLLAGPRGWVHGDMSRHWAERELLRPNRQVLYDVRSAIVIYALAPRRGTELVRILEHSLDGRPDPETGMQIARPQQVLAAMGAGVVCLGSRDVLADLRIAEDFGGWIARDNPNPVPLAYFADGIVPCRDGMDALRAMSSREYEARRPAVEIADADIGRMQGDGAAATVLATECDHGYIRIECEAEDRACLVLRESYEPHYRCLIDGERAQIHRANYLYRAVIVEPGRHTVEFIYSAGDVAAGAIVSCVILVCALAYMIARIARGTAAKARIGNAMESYETI